ncbi:MAG: antiterminator LoaP [Spirochaetaceae bacterium]|nr:MAG: antiterminator LoaP [Spirochaetaceae bacterium]
MQVMTGEEPRFIRRAEQRLLLRGFSGESCRLWWPRRKLTIRRRGRRKPTLAPLFPGYLFIQTDEVAPEMYHDLKRTEGFVRFLPDNRNIEPLGAEGLELIRHFLSFGEVVEQSRVTFDVNNRIVVREGPLSGMEGRIVKVDRRKGRAKVRLDLYSDSFLVDLGFETIDQDVKKNALMEQQ